MFDLLVAMSSIEKKINRSRWRSRQSQPTYEMQNIQVVVCTEEDGGRFAPALEYEHLTYHHHLSNDPERYAGPGGPKGTREAGCYLAHIARQYHRLAKFTAFVHEDVAIHNPVWPRWLSCLRENATFASLSPIIRGFDPLHKPHPGSLKLAQVLGVNVSDSSMIPSSCCFMLIQTRSSLQDIPSTAYASALKMVERREVDAFRLEDIAHLLSSPSKKWLQPCTNFRCEESTCKRMIQFIRVGKEALTHGMPLDKHNNAISSWRSRACGVDRLITTAEDRVILNVTETMLSPCPKAMTSVNSIFNHTGCSNRITTAYLRSEAPQPYPSSFATATVSAKLAVYALKPRMCSALVPCWQQCCAECARRPGCKTWQWTLNEANVSASSCALSADAPARSRPSHSRVVGRM